MNLKNKKGIQFTAETLIFLILNLSFFILLIIFITQSSSGAVVVEESYAKKIGLMLDYMTPGMEVRISLKDLYAVMEKNKFKEFPITVIPQDKIIKVKSTSKTGYSFRYFSEIFPEVYIDSNSPEKILTIKAFEYKK